MRLEQRDLQSWHQYYPREDNAHEGSSNRHNTQQRYACCDGNQREGQCTSWKYNAIAVLAYEFELPQYPGQRDSNHMSVGLNFYTIYYLTVCAIPTESTELLVAMHVIHIAPILDCWCSWIDWLFYESKWSDIFIFSTDTLGKMRGPSNSFQVSCIKGVSGYCSNKSSLGVFYWYVWTLVM